MPNDNNDLIDRVEDEIRTDLTVSPSPLVVFTNPGELDLRLLAVMGVNVKPQASGHPIGQFGTGFKYALAVLLRSGVQIAIQSGLQQVRVITSRTELRGQEFETVELAERIGEGEDEEIEHFVPLGFTTQLGRNWQPWMAFRELWSNAQDEGGGNPELVDQFPPAEAGITRIVLGGDVALAEFTKIGDWLVTSSPVVVIPGELEIHPAAGNSAVFYRGIRVYSHEGKATYSYNILSDQTLTEDRTLDSYSCRQAIVRAVAKVTDQQVAEVILLSQDWEKGFDFDYISTMSPEFLAAVKTQREHQHFNRSARRGASRYYAEELLPTPIPQSLEQRRKLEETRQFLISILPQMTWTSWQLFEDHESEEFVGTTTTVFIEQKAFNQLDFLPKLLNFWEQQQPWDGIKLQHVFLQFVKKHHPGRIGGLLDTADLREPDPASVRRNWSDDR